LVRLKQLVGDVLGIMKSEPASTTLDDVVWRRSHDTGDKHYVDDLLDAHGEMIPCAFED